MDAAPAGRGPRGAIALALASVYLIWGSTYLAIDIAVDSLPPLGLGALRFLIAGTLLYAAVRPFAARPTARQWGSATIVGGFLLAGGNGMVCVAEQRVPSGIAALIVATTPLWMALLTWSTGGARPGWREALGIACGLI
nr:EamA family transporter [Planctomycetota bacterium]